MQIRLLGFSWLVVTAALVLIGLAGAAALTAGHRVAEGFRADGRAEIQAKWDRSNLEAQEVKRKEEAKRIVVQQEIDRDTKSKLVLANNQALSDRAVADRLRQRIKDLSGARCGDTTFIGPGAPDIRIAEVAGSCVSRLTEVVSLARSADLAHASCEAQYNALRGK